MSTAVIETSRRRPRFARAEIAPTFQITERDIEIVRQVARHRFLRSTHISKLLEASHKKILERLTALYHAGYLDRPHAQLEYHVRGGGSAPLIYALGNRGAQLLARYDGYGNTDMDWTHKNRETGREFILHTLAIADVRVALAFACRRNGLQLQQPDELLKTAPPETRGAHNPWAWRVRIPHGGQMTEIGVFPDYVFALAFPDGCRRAFAVEVDRGTMPIERSTLDQTSMLRKFLAYEGTRKQGLHTQRFGWKAFRALVVTSTPERATNMRLAIERTRSLRGTPLFLFADRASVLTGDILGPSWCDAGGKPHSLI